MRPNTFRGILASSCLRLVYEAESQAYSIPPSRKTSLSNQKPSIGFVCKYLFSKLEILYPLRTWTMGTFCDKSRATDWEPFRMDWAGRVLAVTSWGNCIFSVPLDKKNLRNRVLHLGCVFSSKWYSGVPRRSGERWLVQMGFLTPVAQHASRREKPHFSNCVLRRENTWPHPTQFLGLCTNTKL
jgi:hypothetical protein